MSVLLVHGVGGRPRSWDKVLPHLDSALRSRTTAVDVVVQAGQSVADVAKDLLRGHPGRHLIVGHSFGGMIAQEVALLEPARVHGLVLVSTIPGATSRVADINRGLAARIESTGLNNVAEQFATNLFAPGRLERDPELARSFVEDMLEAGSTSVCAALRAVADWDASARLGELSCPSTVVTGDAEPDRDRQALLAQLIHAQFVVLEGTGHLSPLEAPADLARMITEMAHAQSSPTAGGYSDRIVAEAVPGAP